jgi:hypothetical protein
MNRLPLLFAVSLAGLPLAAQVAPSSFVPIGISPNVYSVLNDHQQQVAYDPDLDAVVFVHRSTTPGGQTGALAFDRSLDGGATWSLDLPLTPGYATGALPDVMGNRYPSIALYNPAGNTDPDSAYVATTAPALSSTTLSFWGYIATQTARLGDATVTRETYATSQPGLLIDWLPASLVVQPGTGDLWSIGGTLATGSSSGTVEDYQFVTLNRGRFDPLTEGVAWTLGDTIIEPNYALVPGPLGSIRPLVETGWTIAFSPDGVTGYAAYLGALTGSVTVTMQPIVLKTVDGGATWDRLPFQDMAAFAALEQFLLPSGTGEVVPSWRSIDGAVDAEGRFHLFGRVSPRTSASADSALVVQVGPGVLALAHLSVSDGKDWTARLVDTVDVRSEFYPVVGGVSHPARAQILRSQDGTRIFFVWTDSDSALVFGNELPNLFAQGYDVVTGLRTPTRNVTAGSVYDGSVFYPATAAITRENHPVLDFQIPVVFTVPGATDLDPAQHVYLADAGFTDADFNASVCLAGLYPNNLLGVVGPGGVALRWDPPPGVAGCQLRVQDGAGASAVQAITVPDYDRLNVPAALLTPGTTYAWRVRCACSLPPTGTIPPWSAEEGAFTIPLLREEADDLRVLTGAGRTGLRFRALAKGPARVVWQDAAGRVLQARTVWTERDTEYTVWVPTPDWPAGVHAVTVTEASGRRGRSLPLVR